MRSAPKTVVDGIGAVTKAQVDASIVSGTLDAVNRQNSIGKNKKGATQAKMAASYDFNKAVLSAYVPKGLVADVNTGVGVTDKQSFGAAVVSGTLNALNKV